MPFVRHDPTVQTGSSLVLSYADGCRHFISHQPNNYTLDFSDIDLAMLDGGGHLLRADVWFSQPMLAAGNAQLLRAVARARTGNVFGPQLGSLLGLWCGRIGPARKESVRRILPLVDLVHGNVNELNLFADSTDLAITLPRLAAWAPGPWSSIKAPEAPAITAAAS